MNAFGGICLKFKLMNYQITVNIDSYLATSSRCLL